jgi:phage shock protein B
VFDSDWIGVIAIVLGLPWLIFHYVTQWKRNGSITQEDERLLDELHDLARRLAERMDTVERIISADNPNFRTQITRADDALGAEADEIAAIRRRYADRAPR